MANQGMNSVFSAGSLTKPPTLIREEYPQWKVRMINFLEGMDTALYDTILNGPHVPMVKLPRIPQTPDSEEVPEKSVPKERGKWNDDDKAKIEIANKAKRLLIMALPNDIFISLDSCNTAKELWDQLSNQFEGGSKMKKNRRAQALNEYNAFQALPDETLEQTYHRFNTLINMCKRCEIVRSNEENNVLFLKRLNPEWSNLTMSLQANQDLEEWSLHDVYGTLQAHEKEVQLKKTSVGGPLALMSEARSSGKKNRDGARKGKKAFVSDQSDSEDE